MMESRRSYGWGFFGHDEIGYEWMFTPDKEDSAYQQQPGTNDCYPFCRVDSGYVYTTAAAAVREGEKWMKQAGRSGRVEAVEARPRRFEY